MSSVEGFSEKTCECGCGNLLPLSLMHKPGRRFLYGHKPKAGAGVAVGGSRSTRIAVVHVAGYESTLALVEENLAAVGKRKLEIEEEIGTLENELAQMDVQLQAVTKDLQELDRLRAALAPFCAKPETAGEALAAEATA